MFARRVFVFPGTFIGFRQNQKSPLRKQRKARRGQGDHVQDILSGGRYRLEFVGQAWRDGGTQAALARFLKIPEVEIVPLDEDLSRSCGELCGAAATSDVIDPSVVIIAKERGDTIITSDPYDLRRLDPNSQIVQI
jgi:hypothetical protein